MHPLVRTRLALSASVALVWLCMGSLVADEVPQETVSSSVSVTLADGSRLTAVIDAASSDTYLVLRFSSPGILFRRSVPWNQIVDASLNEQSLTVRDLKQRLKTMHLDEDVLPSDDNHTQPRQPPASSEFRESDQATIVPVAYEKTNDSKAGLRLQRVESLDVFAEAANWDNDVAIDGIRVFIRPLNAMGEIVPINGTVTVKLYGHRFKPVGAVRTFPQLGYWSQRVREQDFRRFGAVYQLKYSGVSPDRDRSLSWSGLAYARLSVPGRGVFQASDALTTIRPFRPYRDWHELETGRRFLPGENVSPGNTVRIRDRPISLPHWQILHPDF